MSTREYMPSWRSFFLSLIVCFVASASIESLQKLNLTENLLCILINRKLMATLHSGEKDTIHANFWPYANSQFQLFHIPHIIYNLAAISKPCTTHKFFVEISSSDIHLILLYFQYVCFTCSLMNASYFRSDDQKLFHRALRTRCV